MKAELELLTTLANSEKDIVEEIKKLDGKGAVTVSVLERRVEKGRREGRQ